MTDVENADLDDDDFQLDPELTLSGRTAQQLLGCFALGDADSLADDAKDLMAIYAKQAMIDRNVSESLNMWVAEVFCRYLSGEAKSLDAGFNQKRRGRPLRMTPKMKRKVIEAYAAGLRAASADGIRDEREAEIRGEHSAYFALHGRTVEQARWSPSVEGAVADSLDRIRAVVNDFFRRR